MIGWIIFLRWITSFKSSSFLLRVLWNQDEGRGNSFFISKGMKTGLLLCTFCMKECVLFSGLLFWVSLFLLLSEWRYWLPIVYFEKIRVFKAGFFSLEYISMG